MGMRRALVLLCVSVGMLGGCEGETPADPAGQSDAGAKATDDGATPLPDAAVQPEDAGPMQAYSSGRVVIFSEQAGTWVVYRDQDNKTVALNQVTDGLIFVSPDGTKLLTADNWAQVWSAADRQVLHRFENQFPGGWVTSERLLLSNVQFNNRRDLRVVDVDGSNPITLTSEPCKPADPPVSFDGKRLLWSEFYGAGSSRLATANVDGSNAKTFEPSKGVRGAPVWTRDGRVVFGMDDGGTPRVGRLHVLSATLEAERAVGDTLERNATGVRPWHPANHVLVTSETTGTGGARILTFYDVDIDTGATVEQPTWNAAGVLIENMHLSADGKKVLYTSGKDVKIADLDGSNAVTISSGYGSTQTARW